MSNPRPGSEAEDNKKFLERVYDIAAKIPPGTVATYGQISMLAGRQYGARLVGYAMRNVPMEREMPCHRVISHNGRLAPGCAFGAAGAQREMLEQEGVTFKANGCVDIKRHIWNGD